MKTNDVKKIIDAQIKKEREYIAEHEAIKDILKRYEGQTISVRILNVRTLGEFKLIKQYGMFHIKGKFNHLIGYDSEDRISIEPAPYSRGYEYFDACHGSTARERIAQLENLDRAQLRNLFGGIEKHFNALRVLFGDIERQNLGSFHNPVYYELLRAIYDEGEDKKGFTLSSLYYLRK